MSGASIVPSSELYQVLRKHPLTGTLPLNTPSDSAFTPGKESTDVKILTKSITNMIPEKVFFHKLTNNSKQPEINLVQ
jgi:hypothetical protein